MAPSSDAQVVDSVATSDVAPPAVISPEDQSDQFATRPRLHARTDPSEPWSGPGSSSSADRSSHNLRVANWLYRSREASFFWLVVRLWLGYEWLNAGYQKIWGSEYAAFISGSVAGVKGLATAGILGSTAGKGGASYGWWAAFLHNFVVPNASWIGQFISITEVVIGIGLILGFLTGYAAFAGLALNLIYMFTGSAGVNPAFAVLSVLLVLAWRNAAGIGLDRFVLRNKWTPHHFGSVIGKLTHESAPAPSPVP